MKPDLELARRQLEETLRDAVQLAGTCDDTKWCWSLVPGVWSAADCFAHLNQTNREYSAAIRRLLDGSNPEKSDNTEYRYGMLERWFVKTMEPPVKMKFKAPPVFKPLSVETREAAICSWKGIHEELMQLVERSEPLHLTRNKVVSPASRFVKLSLGMAFALVAAHNRRHLDQARQMIKRAPSSAAASL